ncbi:amino acid permease [Weissella confusa]|uniref:Amino acid permease n=1 Tax=Weissella confusa TaxID=1583 RepID=A0A923SN41_WEICO|nr:amino acid permease [Weissella confusa]
MPFYKIASPLTLAFFLFIFGTLFLDKTDMIAAWNTLIYSAGRDVYALALENTGKWQSYFKVLSMKAIPSRAVLFSAILIMLTPIINALPIFESAFNFFEPKVINTVLFRILIFYVGALAIIMSIYDWHYLPSNQSPFVFIFKLIGIHWAAALLNFVVLTAAMSAYMMLTGFNAPGAHGGPVSFGNITHNFKFFPNGGMSFMQAFPMVFFAFVGIEFVGLMSAETKNPREVNMAELTAIGLYVQYWLPNVPAWLIEIIVMILLVGVNLFAVNFFGEAEFWFSSIKIIAILGIIATGISSLTGPSILFVYLLTGIFLYIMMRAIGELLYADPDNNSFVAFVSKYLGPGAGHFVGWSYWITLILPD